MGFKKTWSSVHQTEEQDLKAPNVTYCSQQQRIFVYTDLQ